MMKWANKTENQILSEAELKRQLRRSTQHSEDDIVLLLAHLKFTGKMAVENLSASDEPDSEQIICKFKSVESKRDAFISLKEKAKFSLDVSLAKLDQRIEALKNKIAQVVTDLKTALQVKDRTLA